MRLKRLYIYMYIIYTLYIYKLDFLYIFWLFCAFHLVLKTQQIGKREWIEELGIKVLVDQTKSRW